MPLISNQLVPIFISDVSLQDVNIHFTEYDTNVYELNGIDRWTFNDKWKCKFQNHNRYSNPKNKIPSDRDGLYVEPTTEKNQSSKTCKQTYHYGLFDFKKTTQIGNTSASHYLTNGHPSPAYKEQDNIDFSQLVQFNMFKKDDDKLKYTKQPILNYNIPDRIMTDMSTGYGKNKAPSTYRMRTAWYYDFVKNPLTNNTYDDLKNYLELVIYQKYYTSTYPLFLYSYHMWRNIDLFRDRILIYGLSQQFYSQIYQVEQYVSNTKDNAFLKYSIGDLKKYRDTFINNAIEKLNLSSPRIYTEEQLLKFITFLKEKVLLLPEITTSNGNFYLDVWMTSYIRYNQDVSACINNFFRDNYVNVSGTGRTNSNVQLDKDWSWVYYLYNWRYDTKETSEEYEYRTDYVEDKFVDSETYYDLCHRCRIKISKWSLLSLYYYYSTQGVMLCGNLGLTEFEKCVDKENVNDKTRVLCSVGISVEKKYDNILILPPNLDKLFLNKKSDICLCYDNMLQPVNTPKPNTTGMCFATTCNNEVRSLFGITDDDCGQRCGEVCDWITTEFTGQGSSVPEKLDTLRYADLCQDFDKCIKVKDTISLYKYKTNYNILIYASVIGIIFCIYILLLTKIRKRKLIWGVKWILISLVTYIPITIFGVLYFSGNSTCYISKLGGNKPDCLNRWDKRIPSDFCDKEEITRVCDCLEDINCVGTCRCDNNMCVEPDGTRSTVVTYQARKSVSSIIIAISAIICFVLLSSLFGNKNKYYIISIATVITVFVIYVLAKNFTPVPIKQYSSPSCD
jgi:hypothetical protein